MVKYKSPKIVGILNITPDSFSDGHKYLEPAKALEHARKLIKDGANIIDIGAESTRPFATLITPEEEWSRLAGVLPELRKLCDVYDVRISIDTRNHYTLRQALDYIDIINDVSGLECEEMVKLCAESVKPVVIMHSLGVPANPNIVLPLNENPVQYLKNWFYVKVRTLESKGIKKEQIIFDPGIGFGKNAKQSIQILRNIDSFTQLEYQVLICHSRKSFFNYFSLGDEINLDIKTAVLSMYLGKANVDYIKVHNVLQNRLAIENASLFFNFEL